MPLAVLTFMICTNISLHLTLPTNISLHVPNILRAIKEENNCPFNLVMNALNLEILNCR
ncbi:hypothetical protein M758_3G206700 [Ceratodon purpureus]|nr:hypothetical protein M758_3G206700 [Ceratodon purpureus]